MYEPPTKAEAVMDQAREELAHRPRAFFRGLRQLMDEEKFAALASQLLSRFDARRDEEIEKMPPATADLPDGDYEEPKPEAEPEP